MRSTTRVVAAVIAVALLGAAPTSKPSTVPAKNIGADVVILGRLELPVGEHATIRGHKKVRRPPLLQDTFLVETVNGKPAPPETFVNIAGIERWPDGTAATLRGYEVGTLRFLFLHETNFSGPEDPRWKGPHQVLYLRFHASRVVEPAGLELEKER